MTVSINRSPQETGGRPQPFEEELNVADQQEYDLALPMIEHLGLCPYAKGKEMFGDATEAGQAAW